MTEQTSAHQVTEKACVKLRKEAGTKLLQKAGPLLRKEAYPGLPLRLGENRQDPCTDQADKSSSSIPANYWLVVSLVADPRLRMAAGSDAICRALTKYVALS
jgi:hypothetical protein